MYFLVWHTGIYFDLVTSPPICIASSCRIPHMLCSCDCLNSYNVANKPFLDGETEAEFHNYIWKSQVESGVSR